MIFSALDNEFYIFDFGIKASLWSLIPIIYCNFKIFKHYKIPWIFLLICLIDFLIFFSYENFFGLWLGIFLNFALLLAIFDVKYLAVPVWLNFLLVGIVILKLCFFVDLQEVWGFLYQSLALVGFLSFLQVSMRVILNKEVLGDGDIVFIFALGLVFGFLQGLNILFLGSVIGVLIAFCRRKKDNLPLITLLVGGVFLEFLLGVFNV